MSAPRLPAALLQYPIAHRALHDRAAGRPENSRAAIRAAIDAGYSIEIDIQRTHDGQAMVFHDYDLARLTGRPGPIQQHNSADLAALPLLGGDGECIPTLAEVLALVAGRAPLLIELKDQHGQMGVTDCRLERAVAQDLAGYDGPAALMSFNPHMVIAMADLSPQIARGIVTEAYALDDDSLGPLNAETRERLRAIPDYTTARASFISHHWRDLARPRVTELKAAGADVLCWTIRNAADEAEARKIAQNVTFEGYRAALPA
ncbi:glycerophosphodiester phosphodiesterase family protein [Rhodobacteraceae bacterium KMM 6894]|nr:glycerophosphodiester phosphodiesterase family protein [Rhodobacteraceae bacterium KMM 6894]